MLLFVYESLLFKNKRILNIWWAVKAIRTNRYIYYLYHNTIDLRFSLFKSTPLCEKLKKK